MKLLNRDEARKLDTLAMNTYGLPEAVLMENAGASVVTLTEGDVSWKDARVVILCGSGNNGGDGFVTARYASLAGADVVVFLMGDESHMSDASRLYYQVCEKMVIPVRKIKKAEEAQPFLDDADIIVDALIGTGLRQGVSGEKADLIDRANASRAVRIAVDIPSGLICDSGQAEGAVIHADYTVTMGTLKRAHILYPGNEYCGSVKVSPIGIPGGAADEFPSEWVTASDVKPLIPVRTRISHKGSNGYLGIIAGSQGMAGAGLLAAQGALYAGAGKISLFTPQSPAEELTGLLPEIMVRPASAYGEFRGENVVDILSGTDACDVLAIGPGLGRKQETQDFVCQVLGESEGLIIVDADALYAVAAKKFPLRSCGGRLILTPHVGEFARLTGKSAAEIEQHRIDMAASYARENQVILVLKGAPTVTAAPDGRIAVNSTGNPGMASGGMGDTLTGIIAALCGQGLDVWESAVLGVYLHGLAGDIQAERHTVGFTASDVARTVPIARERLLGAD